MADWSSLPADLVNRVADCFLATDDLDYYIDFRAVCHNWRSSTADPRLQHPRQWVMLDEVFKSDDSRLFVNLTTGRLLGKKLPLLGSYHVVASAPGGFLVLAETSSPHAARVLNVFTGGLTRFAAAVPFDVEFTAHVVGSSPTLALLVHHSSKIYLADPDSESFVEYKDIPYMFTLVKLVFTGAIYSAGHGPVASLLSPLAIKIFNNVVTNIATFFPKPDEQLANSLFMVESAGEMLVVIRAHDRMEVFKVDMERNVVEPMKNIGSRALFVGYRRCVSVLAESFAPVQANCIYYVETGDSSYDICVYSLDEEKEVRICGAIDSLNPFTLVRASPPFSLIQLLSSYGYNVTVSALGWSNLFRHFQDSSQKEEDFSHIYGFDFDGYNDESDYSE